MSGRRARIVSWLVVAAVLLFLFAPVALVVLFSFNAGGTTGPPFEGVTLRWYGEVLRDPEYVQGIRNSAIVAAATVVATTILGTLAALGLKRISSRFAAVVGALLAVPLIVPWLFMGLALLVFFSRTQVELSQLTVIVGHVVVTLPVVTLIIAARLARIDPAITEAARDLGASGPRAFRSVLLPQLAPALIGAALLALAMSIDELVITLFVNGGAYTVPVVIYGNLRTGLDASINAIASMLILLTFVLTILAGRLASTRAIVR